MNLSLKAFIYSGVLIEVVIASNKNAVFSQANLI